jgi:hypothetical protein
MGPFVGNVVTCYRPDVTHYWSLRNFVRYLAVSHRSLAIGILYDLPLLKRKQGINLGALVYL